MVFIRHLKSQGQQQQKSETTSSTKSRSQNNVSTPKDVQPKRSSRAPHFKTRTGCITCKIRRVKCDETRPACNRCLKFGTQCDGYLKPNRAPTSSAIAHRNVLPRKGTFIVPSIQQISASSLFENDQESQFFKLYVQDLAVEITPFTTDLWSRVIPQACEAEPYIRQIVSGMGALNYCVKTEEAKGGILRKKTYQYALSQYDKALRGMREAISKGNRDVRHALLACLLVFCFENLQGDSISAARNARSGLVLLSEYMAQQIERSPNINFLASHQNKLRGFYGLETDLLHAFAALDVHILFFLDTRSGEQHMGFVEQFKDTIQKQMPTLFESLEQSRDFWLMLQSRNSHFNAVAIEELSKGRKKTPNWDKEINVKSLDDYGLDDWLEESVSNSPQDTITALKAQMEGYREDIRRWWRGTSHIFTQVSMKGTQEEKVEANLLQIRAHLNHIQLSAAFMSSDMEYDAFLPEHTAIVELSEEIYPYLTSNPVTGSGGMFRFELGVVYPLSAVGFRCRDSPIRTRAISLLKRSSYREGVWEAESAALITGWIQKVEEEGMDSKGFIPEASRAVMTVCDVDWKSKSVRLGCVSKAETDGGDEVYREERLEWKFGLRNQLDAVGGDTCYFGGGTIRSGLQLARGVE